MYRYGLALFLSLSSLATAPAWAGGHGCFGSRFGPIMFGCQGGCNGGCQGTYYSGYYGGGCCGGGGFYSGCWGSAPVSYGCWGSRSVSFSCNGSGFSCNGSGFGYYNNGVPVGYSAYYGDDEEVIVGPPQRIAPPPPDEEEVKHPPRELPVKAKTPAPAPRIQPASEPSDVEEIGAPEEGTSKPAPATIQVSLPAGAKLYINNKLSQSTTTNRKFVSPPLKPGQDYHYTFKAEMAGDDGPMTCVQKVAVRAGEEIQVVLDFSTAAGSNTQARPQAQTPGPPSEPARRVVIRGPR